jgi:hypothetical protein
MFSKLAIWFENRLFELKGTVPRDFRLQVFYSTWISFLQAPDYCIPLGTFQLFVKIRRDIRSSRCTTCVDDTGGTGGAP